MNLEDRIEFDFHTLFHHKQLFVTLLIERKKESDSDEEKEKLRQSINVRI